MGVMPVRVLAATEAVVVKAVIMSTEEFSHLMPVSSQNISTKL